MSYSGDGMSAMLYLLVRTKMTNTRGHKNREGHFIQQARATPEAIIKAVVFPKKAALTWELILVWVEKPRVPQGHIPCSVQLQMLCI